MLERIVSSSHLHSNSFSSTVLFPLFHRRTGTSTGTLGLLTSWLNTLPPTNFGVDNIIATTTASQVADTFQPDHIDDIRHTRDSVSTPTHRTDHIHRSDHIHQSQRTTSYDPRDLRVDRGTSERERDQHTDWSRHSVYRKCSEHSGRLVFGVRTVVDRQGHQWQSWR